MQYRETPPCPALAPYVRCFWTLTSALPFEPQFIVPDGCTELILHRGDRFKRWFEDGSHEMQPRNFAVGQMERAIVIEPTGKVDVLGVRFHPAGLAAFTRIPQQELRDRMTSCEDLWGPAAPRDLEDIPSLERFLLGRLRPRERPTAIGGRQQRRRYQELVGLSPKRLQRVERLQLAMSQLGHRDLAAVAMDAGYFDQPHFTREFRAFTGQTPAQFLRAPQALSDFFTHNARKPVAVS